MANDLGRVASDRAGGLRPEPAAQSQPVGAHPSRDDPASSYIVGTLDERKAVTRFLAIRSARAAVHGASLPWWAYRRRRLARLTAAANALAAKEIEEAQHIEDQAVWVVELSGGFIIGREAFRRDRDASLAEDAGTAAEPRSGGSPGPEGIAQGEVA